MAFKRGFSGPDNRPNSKFARVDAPSKTNRDKINTDGLSNAQLAKLIGWGLKHDFQKQPWWDLKVNLVSQVSRQNAVQTLSEQSYPTAEIALSQLIERGRRILGRVFYLIPQVESQDGEFAWIRKMAIKGTLADKYKASTELLRACPILHVADFRKVQVAVRAKNRTESMLALEFAKELFASDFLLPPDRHLEFMNDANSVARDLFLVEEKGSYRLNVNGLDQLSARAQLLTILTFENDLKVAIMNLIQSINDKANDNIVYVRKTVIENVYQMLACRSEQEDKLLTTLVRSLGDLDRTVSRLGMEKLGSLLHLHAGMKPIVSKKVEELIWMQKLKLSVMHFRTNAKKTVAMKREKARRHQMLKLARKKAKELCVKFEEDGKELPKEDEDKSGQSFRRAYTATINAVHFLSEMEYSKNDPKNFVNQMLNRYVRCLIVMLRPLESISKEYKRVVRRQVHHLNRKGHCETEPLCTFAHGLAFTSVGAHVVRRILKGVRRLLQYITPEKLTTAFGKHEPKSESDVVKSHTMVKKAKGSKKEESKKELNNNDEVKVKIEQDVLDSIQPEGEEARLTGHASIDIAAQLFILAHRAPEFSTKIYTWDLLYQVLKKTHRLSATFYANFYNAIRNSELFEAKVSPMLLDLICEMISDKKNVTVTVRVALLRRLLTMASFYGNPPSKLLRIFELILQMQNKSTDVAKWIRSKSRKTDSELGNNFSPDSFNPQASAAETTQPWEFSLLQASMFAPLREAATSCKTDKTKIDDEDDESVYMRKHWPGLLHSLESSESKAARGLRISMTRRSIMRCLTLRTMLRLITARPVRSALGAPDSGARLDVDENIKLTKMRGNDPLGQQAYNVEVDDEGEALSKSAETDVWNMSLGTRALWNSELEFPFREMLQPHFEDAIQKNKYASTDVSERVNNAFDEAESAFLKGFGLAAGDMDDDDAADTEEDEGFEMGEEDDIDDVDFDDDDEL